MAKYKLSDRIPAHIWELAGRFVEASSVPEAIPRPLLRDDQLAEELKERFRKVPYPYKSTRAQTIAPRSTFQQLDKLGILNALFEPRVIRELKFWAIDYVVGSADFKQFHSTESKAGKEFRNFYLSLAKELARHLKAIERIEKTYRLGDQLIGGYRRGTEERLMKAASMIRFYIERRPDSDSEVLSDSMEVVHSIIAEALHKKGVKNDALCRHLTSVVLSSNSRQTGHLSPDPEAVRKSLQRRAKKKKQRVLDKTTK